MKNSLQKFIIAFFAVLFVFEPILQLSQIPKTKAAPDLSQGEDSNTSLAYDGGSTDAQPTNIDAVAYKIPLKTRTKTTSTNDIFLRLADIYTADDREAGIGLDEAFSNQVEPRIILNPDDQRYIKILWRMSGTWMMPNFEQEPETIWVQYPKFKAKFQKENPAAFAEINSILGHDINSVNDIAALKTTSASDAGRARYLDLTHAAQLEWTSSLGDVATEIKKQTDDAMNKSASPTSAVIECISDVTDQTTSYISQIFADNADSTKSKEDKAKNATKYKSLMDTFADNVKAVKIDIRVINMLTYLVTPKTQGGAGHYKIKVKRILASYTAPKKIFSRESDTIYNSGVDASTNADPRTAADWGISQPDNASTSLGAVSTNDFNDNADALVYDQSGDSYNAFVSEALAADATPAAVASDEKNISAHSDGQAVDISEVDDIRCTLIKKRRVGGYSRSKFLQRPIKLAWQTSSGYAENGGGDLYKSDMANVMKSFASDSIRDLVSEFGGDISEYDGDLSSAGFSEVAMLVGKSLFSQIINSPGSNLKGYDFGNTLTQLGGMYMADYLGLPREMFIGTSIPDSYDELAQRIGTAAVEKRLDLPIGTFGGNNLTEMLQKVGQRKLEFEMNLNAGALDKYFHDYKDALGMLTVSERGYLIGKAIIEQELNLPQGSFTGINNHDPKNYAELKQSLGEIKANMVFRDPAYADNLLHIPLGSTAKMMKDDPSMTPYLYGSLVGSTREDDTINGFSHMAAADAAYELDEGTFEKILKGDLVALADVGIKNLARVFTTGDDERVAFTQWVKENMAKDANNKELCMPESTVKVTIPATATTPAKEVTLSDAKAINAGMHSGDMFSMFICPSANPGASFQTIGSTILRNALIQYYLTPDEKVKFNLMETNPVFHSSDPEKIFYLTRINNIITLVEQIKSNWAHTAGSKDYEFVNAKKVIDDAIATISSIVGTTPSITDISQMKTTARNVAVSINKFKSDTMTLCFGANRSLTMINGTLSDINELTRNVAEILEGKVIPTTDAMTLKMIPGTAFTDTPDTTSSAPVLNEKAAPRSSNSSLIGLAANKQTFMALLSRKMTPADFFLIMAADKVEISLDLPQNSLVYFVQNFEKKGLGAIDSFYSAVGQAKIEETFGMPSKYFQGGFISDVSLDAPDFRNDLTALYEYGKYDVEAKVPPITLPDSVFGSATTKLENVKLKETGSFINPVRENINKTSDVDFSFMRDDGTAPVTLTDDQRATLEREHYITGLASIKKNSPSDFDTLVNKAQANYKAQLKTFINSLSLKDRDLEVSVWDIVQNVDAHKLNDKIRTPEQDLLFRMGFSGSSLAALTSTTNKVAWLDASGRANQIDKMFNLPTGTTKSLFTGDRIDSGSGGDIINTKDKQKLVAEMGISPSAIDLLQQVLSGDIPYTELDKKATDITNLGDNPYFNAPTDTCNELLTDGTINPYILDVDTTDGSKTKGQIISNSMTSENWFYFDQTIIDRGGKSFGSRIQAEQYRSDHVDEQVTYIQELAYGLSKLFYAPGDVAKNVDPLVAKIKTFVAGGESVFTGDLETARPEVEKDLGLEDGALNKLFSVTTATDVDVPLVSYKRAVGRQVINQTINSKIFNALGIHIDPSLFTGNEFFDIMKGDYSSLWNIAGDMVDQKLNIPYGSTRKILTAGSAAIKECSMAEIGSAVIGRYIGLDYVSLGGNIYDNVGRSRLEKTLGLPKNSFSGSDIDELMKNVGPVNFYLAFDYPVLGLGTNLQNAIKEFYGDTFAKEHADFSNTYKLTKIKEFLDINTNLANNPTKNTAYEDLKRAMITHVDDTSGNAMIGGSWRKDDKADWGVSGKAQEDEVTTYLMRINSIDLQFGITAYYVDKSDSTKNRESTTATLIHKADDYVYDTYTTTCRVEEYGDGFQRVDDPDGANRIRWSNCNDSHGLTGPGYDTLNIIKPDGSTYGTTYAPKKAGVTGGGYSCECGDSGDETNIGNTFVVEYNPKKVELSPEEYVRKIAGKTLTAFAASKAFDIFDVDLSDSQRLAVIGTITNFSNWTRQSNAGAAKIYRNFSYIFSYNLDGKAGFDPGTIASMIENPGRIMSLLMPQAAKKLDNMFGLTPTDKWSVSGIYARYLNPTADPTKVGSSADDCRDTAELKALKGNIDTLQGQVDDWINTNGGIVSTMAESAEENVYFAKPMNRIEDRPGYVDYAKKIGDINALKRDYDSRLTACKAGNRNGGVSGADTPFHIDTDGANDPITNAITKYCSSGTISPANREMCDEISTPIVTEDCTSTWLTDTDQAACYARVDAGGRIPKRDRNIKWKFAWIILTDYASDKISDYIFSDKVTNGTLRMPPDDIKMFFAHGDMRYFTAALMTFQANTWLNKLGHDDPSTPQDERMEKIPTDMQVTYGMVKLWVIGSPDAENYAAIAAANAALDPKYNAPDYEFTLSPAAMGDVDSMNLPSGFFGAMLSRDFIIGQQNVDNEHRTANVATEDQLVGYNEAQTTMHYWPVGDHLTDEEITNTKTAYDTLAGQAKTCSDYIDNFISDPAHDSSYNPTPEESKHVGDCETTVDRKNNLDLEMANARRDARDRFGKQLEYRTMDAVLWTKDHNIFPGFSYMLFEGSPEQKNVALCTYLKNAFVTGTFFGKSSAQLQKIEAATGLNLWDWTKIASFIKEMGDMTSGKIDANQVLADACGDPEHGPVADLSKFISHYSENWFGFKIDVPYAKAGLVGIITGHYGFNFRPDKGDFTNPTDGKTYQTIGGLYKEDFFNRSMLKPFAWADKQAGWKPGTAQAVYTQGVYLFKSANTLRELETLEKLQNEKDQVMLDALWSGKTNAEAIDIANNSTAGKSLAAAQARDSGTEALADKQGGATTNKYSATKIFVKEQIVLYVGKLLGDAIMRWINTKNAQNIADMETRNSLVPGSLSTLINSAVSYGAANATIWIYNQTLNAGANMSFLGPAALYVALALFIGTNLFGFYDSDLKCSADGYYPEIETPSIANDSESGLGEWDGMNDAESQQKTIASAQYKAKRLIQDVLEMHKNPKYSDVIPSQILTGRNEDVLALNDSITENMCSQIGLIAIAGVCGGDTQAAVQQRDETTTYTHIGF